MKPSNTFDEIVKATGSALIGLVAGQALFAVFGIICTVCGINFPGIGAVGWGMFAILAGSIPGYLNPRYAVLGTTVCVGGHMLFNWTYNQLAHTNARPLESAVSLGSIALVAIAAAFAMRTWRLRDLRRKSVAQ